MSCIRVRSRWSNISDKCLRTLHLKSKPKRNIQISAPFNFQPGPLVNFPGYSEDDISLMREKAIASTAVVEDGDCRLDYEFDMGLRLPRPRSRASTYSGGMGGRPIRTPRRYSVSRGPISVYQGLPL